MTAVDDAIDVPSARGGAGKLILVLVLALVMGGAGFFASFSGLFSFSGNASPQTADSAPVSELAGDSAFIPLDPLVVTIRASGAYRMLRFTGNLEVAREHAAELSALRPRIADVMNTYLNALQARHFEDPLAMLKLRAQLLRRIQIVTGADRVRDLLILEFILQ